MRELALEQRRERREPRRRRRRREAALDALVGGAAAVEAGVSSISKANGYYTHAELAKIFDANSPDVPYVYDNFEWPHCTSSGYPKDLMTVGGGGVQALLSKITAI